MPSRYAQWMYDWEHRLTSVDNNRVVRPLDWGIEFAQDWPCRNGSVGQPVEDPAKFFIDFNRRIVASSDEFFSDKTPTDFHLEKREVQVFSTREVPDPKLEAKVKGTFAEFLRFTAPVKDALSGKDAGGAPPQLVYQLVLKPGVSAAAARARLLAESHDQLDVQTVANPAEPDPGCCRW